MNPSKNVTKTKLVENRLSHLSFGTKCYCTSKNIEVPKNTQSCCTHKVKVKRCKLVTRWTQRSCNIATATNNHNRALTSDGQGCLAISNRHQLGSSFLFVTIFSLHRHTLQFLLSNLQPAFSCFYLSPPPLLSRAGPHGDFRRRWHQAHPPRPATILLQGRTDQ